jgi:hypothetical protein
MAEQMILVCDVCGKPAAQSVSLKVDGRSLTKDVCERHLTELTKGARASRPGRRRKATTVGASKRSSSRAGKKTTTRRRKGTSRRRKSAANRSKTSSSPASNAK